jgi:hypothetical protein
LGFKLETPSSLLGNGKNPGSYILNLKFRRLIKGEIVAKKVSQERME